MFDAWALLQQVVNEQNEMKEKFNYLLRVVVKLLEQKMEEENNEPQETFQRKKSLSKKFKCKFFNKGFCRDGIGCDFFHPEEDCQEFLETGLCPSRKYCPHRHPHQCRYWAKGECWRGETCVFQHKALDLAKENDSDDDDDEDVIQMNNEKDDSEYDSQPSTDTSKDNADSVHGEDFRTEPDYGLTTDEILELYENVELDDAELISTEDIIKMYETDVEEESDSAKDLYKVKKSSKRKKKV